MASERRKPPRPEPKPAKAAKKKRRKRSSKQVATGLAIAQRREKVAMLKLAGWTVRDISGHLKCSVGTVQTDIDAAYAAAEGNAEAYIKREKAISLARLEVANKGIWPLIETGDLDAIDRLVKLEARRAKTIGFDAAEKQEIDAKVSSVTAAASPAEAARLIRQAFGEHAAQKNAEPSALPESPTGS